MKVEVSELREQQSQLMAVMRRMLETEDTLSRLSRAMSRETVGERLAPAVKSMAETMELQAKDMAFMASALRQIADEYERCEHRIVEYAHDERFVFVRWPPGLIYINPIEQLLGPGGHQPRINWTVR